MDPEEKKIALSEEEKVILEQYDKKNKRRGIGCIVASFIPFLLVIFTYTIGKAFILNYPLPLSALPPALQNAPAGVIEELKLNLLNFTVGFMGAFALLILLVGLTIGIYRLIRKKAADIQKIAGEEKYQKLSLPQVIYIMGNSWSAYFGSFVWPLGNKLYLWAIVPLLGFVLSFAVYYVSFPKWFANIQLLILLLQVVVMLILTLAGRKIAWEKKSWDSFASFKKRQSLLVVLVLLFWLANIALAFYSSWQFFRAMSSLG